MKKMNDCTIAIICIFFLSLGFACNSKTDSQSSDVPEEEVLAGAETDTANSIEEEVVENEGVQAISIWEDTSVRESAGAKGKWLTSLSIGETVFYLEEKQTVDKKEYAKIRLQDGKEGWSFAAYIITDSKAAVFKNDTELYKRPDLLTKSGKKFSKMDIVAIKPATQDGWAPVEGKRSKGKWIDKGWVKISNVSQETVDIAVAKFAQKALKMDDITEKEEILSDLISNSDFANSVFIPEMREILEELQAPEVLESSVEEEDSLSDEGALL